MFTRQLLTGLATLVFATALQAGSNHTTQTSTKTTTTVRAVANEEAMEVENEFIPAESCCADFRKDGGCWRKCGGNWKDLLPSEEYCRKTDARAKCRAEYRTGGSGGCWMKCRGFFTDNWKEQVDETFCQIRKCGSVTAPTPVPTDPGDGTVIPPPSSNGCCVDFRNGGGCWRKCNGKWKDLMPNESVCRDSDPRERCHAEYRTGGGCWRKCDGKWKDKFPTELECQVRRCQ